MVREGYQDLIDYVTYKTGKSDNMARNVIKEYSSVLKDSIRKGNTVRIDGLVKIEYTTKRGYIYKNREYTLESQIEDISKRLNLGKFDVQNIIVTYLRRIRSRVLEGYQVNIIGVCYLIPKKEQDELYVCTPRVSPVLDKPELVDFVIVTENGIILEELTDEDIRFKIDVDDDIEVIYSMASQKQKRGLSLTEVDI